MTLIKSDTQSQISLTTASRCATAPGSTNVSRIWFRSVNASVHSRSADWGLKELACLSSAFLILLYAVHQEVANSHFYLNIQRQKQYIDRSHLQQETTSAKRTDPVNLNILSQIQAFGHHRPVHEYIYSIHFSISNIDKYTDMFSREQYYLWYYLWYQS